jgi:hypothetical protein
MLPSKLKTDPKSSDSFFCYILPIVHFYHFTLLNCLLTCKQPTYIGRTSGHSLSTYTAAAVLPPPPRTVALITTPPSPPPSFSSILICSSFIKCLTSAVSTLRTNTHLYVPSASALSIQRQCCPSYERTVFQNVLPAFLYDGETYP